MLRGDDSYAASCSSALITGFSEAVHIAIMTKILVAFDLYGTLLSTASIATKLAVYLGEEIAGSVAAVWRRYQLEYTWRLNSMSADASVICHAVSANFSENNINHSRTLLGTVSCMHSRSTRVSLMKRQSRT